MSTNVWWEPLPQEKKKNYLGLKYEIGKYFIEDYNGENGKWTADSEMIPFLKGIMAVGNKDCVKDAKTLIESINKYGKVIITIG